MYNVTIEDEFGNIRSVFQYASLAEATRNASAGTKHEQGRAIVDEDEIIVYEFKYEGGDVRGYDDQGTPVFNV